MEAFSDMFWPVSIPIVAITGAFIYAIVQTLARARVRELEVRERIAMIERGLVPPPEKDPTGFERAMSRYERAREQYDDWDDLGRRRGPNRYRSAGVTMMGVGFGLMLLIGVTGGAPEAAVGVGGFMVVMGMAFFLNGWLSRSDTPRSSMYRQPPAGPTGEPPKNYP